MANALTVTESVNMDCINPTEPTYRHWTSEILVAHFDKDTCRGLDRASKVALMDHLKKQHKKSEGLEVTICRSRRGCLR